MKPLMLSCFTGIRQQNSLFHWFSARPITYATQQGEVDVKLDLSIWNFFKLDLLNITPAIYRQSIFEGAFKWVLLLMKENTEKCFIVFKFCTRY